MIRMMILLYSFYCLQYKGVGASGSFKKEKAKLKEAKAALKPKKEIVKKNANAKPAIRKVFDVVLCCLLSYQSFNNEIKTSFFYLIFKIKLFLYLIVGIKKVYIYVLCCLVTNRYLAFPQSPRLLNLND
jgi:hypothetical protein